MRKLILFFSVVIAGLFLTSCLEAGDSNFSGQRQLFYITQLEGTQVAHNGDFVMTSNEIKSKDPDRWYLITWSWSTENGMVSTNVHNAITPEIEQIPLGIYSQQEAPQETMTPVLNFNMVGGLPIAGSFGDFLIVQYVWNKKEGEKVQAKLYNETTQPDATDTYILELRLEKSGTSTETSGKNVDGFAAFDVSSLRSLVNFNGQDFKDIQLKFNYYKENAGQPTSVTQPVRIYKN